MCKTRSFTTDKGGGIVLQSKARQSSIVVRNSDFEDNWSSSGISVGGFPGSIMMVVFRRKHDWGQALTIFDFDLIFGLHLIENRCQDLLLLVPDGQEYG